MATLHKNNDDNLNLNLCQNKKNFSRFFKSLLLKKFFDFCHRPLVPKSIFPHTFLVSFESSYSLDVPFCGLNFTNRQGLAHDPLKFSFGQKNNMEDYFSQISQLIPNENRLQGNRMPLCSMY
jgi:hypothetical protein